MAHQKELCGPLVEKCWPESSCFWLSYQWRNSPGDCTRELFKPLKDSASFVSDVINGAVLDLFGPLHLAMGPNH